MIGKTLSHYKILKKLGEGGMGEVYLAEDTKLKRKTAIKLLPPHLTKNKESRERFEREAQAAAALNHPNIVTVHEIGEFEDQVFIVMEYVEGETLQELIIDNRQLSIDNCVNIAIQICEGLEKAHQADIIHRDIKPGNIIIDKDNRVKILDFGLAKLKGVSQLTKETSTIGTIHYMSPEQVRGEEVDHRSDIWSLGVILYEMVLGELPFNGEYEQAIMYSIVNEYPESIIVQRPGIHFKLERIIKKAMAKEPIERFQEISNFLGDLKETGKADKILINDEQKTSIAVLPFTDMSPEKDQEYFCEGMAEELINALTKIGKLKVVSRTSAFQFSGKGYDIKEIGEKLNVQTVLEGSIRKAENKIRITSQLVNVSDGYQIWSEKYDRDLNDIFTIQDEISLSIVDKLKIKLFRDERIILVKHHTEDKEAYNLYLKGRYFWNRRSEVGFSKAFEFFQSAIEVDPLYALPYIGIADTYNISGHFCFMPPKEAFENARTAATKALEIDNNLSEAHTSLAWIYTYSDRNWELAEKKYKLSIELNPEYATAYEWFSLFLAGKGRFDEAITEIRKALVLDPVSTMINAILGVILIFQRRFKEAIIQFKKTLEMNQNFPFTYIWQGMAYWGIEDYDRALVSLLKFEALAKEMTYGLGLLGMAYGLANQDNKAFEVFEKMERISENKYVSSLHKAFIFIGLSNKDKAFELMNKAYIEKDPFLFYSKTLPMYDSLRTDPRYSELLKKLRLER